MVTPKLYIYIKKNLNLKKKKILWFILHLVL